MKKRTILPVILLVLFIGSTIPGYGQIEIAWERNFGDRRTEERLTAMKRLGDGSLLLVGQTEADGRRPSYLIKTDEEGEVLWTSIHEDDEYSFTVYGVHELPRGRFVMVGEKYRLHHDYNWIAFTNNRGWVIDENIPDERFGSQFYSIFPIDGGYMLSGKSGYIGNRGNFWLYQVDAEGGFVRLRHYEGFRVTRYANCIRAADSGFVYAGTTDQQDFRRDDFILFKANANRDSLWCRSFDGGRDDDCYSMKQTSDGGFILVGSSRSSVNDHQIWVIRTDAEGEVRWIKAFGGASSDVGYDVIEASGGGFAIAAKVTGADNRPRGSLIRIDQHGTPLWNDLLGGERTHAFEKIEQAADGGFILGGMTEYTDQLARIQDDIYLVKTSPDPTLTHRIPLRSGWNLISSVCPPGDDSLELVMSEIASRGNLLLMKNGAGRFYNPIAGDNRFNNIPGWNVSEGYAVKAREPDTLEIVNIPVEPSTPIPLRRGWNIVPYFQEIELTAPEAFASLDDRLLMAKDDEGRFYNPAFNYSNMGRLQRGKGYLVKLERPGELIYPDGEFNADAQADVDTDVIHFVHHRLTGGNMSVLIEVPDQANFAAPLWEVGAFTESGICVGAASLGSLTGMAVWADDPTTPEIDGAVEGEAIHFRVWDGTGEAEAEFIHDEKDKHSRLSFSTDGFASGSISIGRIETSNIPTVAVLRDAYPNPFNSATLIKLSLPRATEVSLTVSDINGKDVARLIEGWLEAGAHEAVWAPAFLPTGLYFIRLESSFGILGSRVILIR